MPSRGAAAWLVAWLLFPVASPGQVVRFSAMKPAQIDAFLKDLQNSESDVAERLVMVSEHLVGTPYLFSPMGEGQGRDPKPIIRFDAIDCMALVELSLALALSPDVLQATERLQQIRYLEWVADPPAPRIDLWSWLNPALADRLRRARHQSRMVDYAHRKHFVMSQWIPMNQRAGFLEDITEQVAGGNVVWVEKHLDAAAWQRRRQPRHWPALKDDQVPQGDFRLPVLPLAQVLDLAGKIPQGTIVSVVRKEDPAFFDPIVHLALVVKKGDKVFLRHAVPKGYRKVIDEPLETFVRRNLGYLKKPVEGFNLQRSREDSRRFFDAPQQKGP